VVAVADEALKLAEAANVANYPGADHPKNLSIFSHSAVYEQQVGGCLTLM
jgi:hypothetical protein